MSCCCFAEACFLHVLTTTDFSSDTPSVSAQALASRPVAQDAFHSFIHSSIQPTAPLLHKKRFSSRSWHLCLHTSCTGFICQHGAQKAKKSVMVARHDSVRVTQLSDSLVVYLKKKMLCKDGRKLTVVTEVPDFPSHFDSFSVQIIS